MRLMVDLVPKEQHVYSDVVIVVDVIRATTTAVAFLEAGARELYLTPSLDSARSFNSAGVVLAGEEGGLMPLGFHYGNSPRDALEGAVGEQTIVMCTTNGTRAAHMASKTAKHVILASLYNAHAAARLANSLATDEVAILCAGADNKAGLDDTYTAGVLVEYLQLMGQYELTDGAYIAAATRKANPDSYELLMSSRAAQLLKQVGLESDVAFCAQIAQSQVVPLMESRVGDALIFRRGVRPNPTIMS